jgi:hypothetical protein
MLLVPINTVFLVGLGFRLETVGIIGLSISLCHEYLGVVQRKRPGLSVDFLDDCCSDHFGSARGGGCELLSVLS